MTASRIALIVAPIMLMIAAVFGLTGIEQWLASLGKTEAARLTLARSGITLPYSPLR